jgi:hypothetical protein
VRSDENVNTKRQRAATQFTEPNRRAAAGTLVDPAKYGGDGALMIAVGKVVLS